MANHQLLTAIGPYDAWFYVPTRNEEQSLGYDASLQGYKALIIQYKRLRIGGRVGVRLSKRQHGTLVSRFPKSRHPYVFYGFTTHRTYADLHTQFQSGRGIDFGAHASMDTSKPATTWTAKPATTG